MLFYCFSEFFSIMFFINLFPHPCKGHTTQGLLSQGEYWPAHRLVLLSLGDWGSDLFIWGEVHTGKYILSWLFKLKFTNILALKEDFQVVGEANTMVRPGNSDSFFLNFAFLVGRGSFHFIGILMLSFKDIQGPHWKIKVSGSRQG